MAEKTTNVMMVGVGGQGIILASELLSEAALLAGYDVRKSEVHGMAQRGGSVSSHVRFGAEVRSPLIERGGADIMLAFEKVECLRAIDMLREGGTIILNDQEVIPTTVSIGMGSYPGDVTERLGSMGYDMVVVDAVATAREAGTVKTANVVLLARLASYLDIERDIWLKVIEKRVPTRFLDVNFKAFEMGYSASR